MQQVGSYLGYSGRGANAFGKAAPGPEAEVGNVRNLGGNPFELPSWIACAARVETLAQFCEAHRAQPLDQQCFGIAKDIVHRCVDELLDRAVWVGVLVPDRK